MPERRLRIATFNLENLGVAAEGRGALDQRLPLLRAQLQRLRADVLCLQEVDAQRPPPESTSRSTSRSKPRSRQLEALQSLLAESGYAGFDHAVSLDRSGKRPADKHNLVILSRWPLIAWESLHHRLVPAPRLQYATALPPSTEVQPITWDRPLLRASLRLPDGPLLHIVNMHLRAPLAAPVPGQRRRRGGWQSLGGWAEGFYLASLKRSGQALEARLLVEELLALDIEALVLVAGDMNAGENEAPLRILRGAAADVDTPDLAGGELTPLARNLPQDRRYSVLHDGRAALYDHLLASPGLTAHFLHCEIHNEALHDEGALPPGSPQSFHAPLVAEFTLA